MQKQNPLKYIKWSLLIILSFVFCFSFFSHNNRTFKNKASAQEVQDLEVDYGLFEKYNLYENYQKKEKYKKYKKYKKNKDKYGFDSSQEKAQAKESYAKYKLYKKDPAKYRSYAQYYEQYKKYSKYKKYVTPYSEYKRYSKYKKYNKSEYDDGKEYGGAEYKAGHDRYEAALDALVRRVGEADLGCGTQNSEEKCLGPEITVGLHAYTKSELTDDSFRIESASNAETDQDIAYTIKNGAGEILATVPAGSPSTRVKLNADKTYRIYNSVTPEITASGEIYFDSAIANDSEAIVFDTNVPIASYDKYRGKIKLRYCNGSSGYCDAGNSATSDRIWVINALPLEQYVWGMGELNLANVAEHNKVMISVYRTYGYWKIKFGTKYANQGFKVTATPSSQIYKGYNYEIARPAIVQAAEDTWGKIIRYGGEITISPYSSWTDGRTRSFEERWGSTQYPWCRSVADPYGKHATMSTTQLEQAGNHMVGLSANGSVTLAYSHGWTWQNILNYYFYNINIFEAY